MNRRGEERIGEERREKKRKDVPGVALVLSVEYWLQWPRGARVHLAEAAGTRASLAATSPDKVRAL